MVAFALTTPLAPGDSLLVDLDWDARPSTIPRRQGTRGRRYDFAFETHAVAGQAGARLKWKGPGMNDTQFITEEYLFAPARKP